MGGISLSRDERVMGVLLVLVPATLVAARAGWPPVLQFFLAVGAVIPLAAYIGAATESLADRLGAKIGGLLNATFGNSPDLLVGIFGVQKGLIPLVKATLVGAITSNSALITGVCYVAAGLVYRRPRFTREEAGHHSILMMLTVAAVLFPSVGAFVVCGGPHCGSPTNRTTLLHVSVGIAAALIVTYVAYVVYGIFGIESLRNRQERGRESVHFRERVADHVHPAWPTWFAVAVLLGATAALIPVTDILTGSVEAVTHVL